MKKISLIVFVIFSCVACKKNVDTVANNIVTAAIIPESAVPAAVLTSFNSSFSSSTEREWHHTSDDRFVCQFDMDNQRHEADFDDKGKKSDDNVISINGTVPSIILDAFSTNFPSDLVDEWTLANEGTWKAEFSRGGIKWEVTFDSAGAIIKSEHD